MEIIIMITLDSVEITIIKEVSKQVFIELEI